MSPIVDQWRIEMTLSLNLMANGTTQSSTRFSGREIFFLGHIVEALWDSNPGHTPTMQCHLASFPDSSPVIPGRSLGTRLVHCTPNLGLVPRLHRIDL